jgi:ditrans,polycis-polyprenyl diphosphate synthase
MAGIALSLPPLICKCLSGKWAVNQLRDLCIGALKQGPIPQHIAFVMDGNRRYARSHGIETSSGHYRGYEAFDKVCNS